MADDNFDQEDRTEPATPRRREEALDRGQVARSGDLNSALVCLAALGAMHWFGGKLLEGMTRISRASFGGLHMVDISSDTLTPRAAAVLWLIARSLFPLLAAVVIVALAANLAQVGTRMTGDPLMPNLGRLNPITGLARLFTARSAGRLILGLFKVASIAAITFYTLSQDLPALLALPGLAVPRIAAGIGDLAFVLALRAAIALVVLGVVDYGLQRWQWEKDLRMSKHEVKEEMKRMDGNPRMRERRRAIQRQMATQRMMAAVPKAAVVITNPTHFAVALAYDDDMAAPRMVAKGADLIAERIREIAMESGVPIVQKPPLARALFHGCEVGKDIPGKLYEAVAEVLAYVYSLKKAA